MGELSKLPNIGKVVEEQLNQVGITTVDQLIDLGSKEAWLRIKAIDDAACINRLQGLEGARQGSKKNDLPEKTKEDLKEFYREHK